MSRPVHFEVHAEDPLRAIAFYTSVFGWKFMQWEGGPMEYWLIMTGGDEEAGATGDQNRGIDGGMMRRQGPPPEDGQALNAYPCTMMSDDIDATAAAVNAAGGIISLPKMAIPGVGWLFYAKDTEGNIFGVMQSDESAGK